MVKADSADMVAALHQMGKEVIMLTGDNDQTAQAIAQKVGIKRVISQVLPQEKSRVISDLQAEGKSVIMVGDGINDAPALATADIGIAMGSGTDIAMESADMVLMKPNLMDLVKALKISQATITKGRVFQKDYGQKKQPKSCFIPVLNFVTKLELSAF